MNAFLAIFWIGAITCGFVYWFKYSTTNDNYILRRYKTAFAMFFWPIFVLRLVLANQSQQTQHRQTETEDARRRILGD
jgi:hypothetical protein